MTYQGYHSFQEANGNLFGQFEVFHIECRTADDPDTGWYWQACWPGAMPDGDAFGPYPTAQEAWAAALDW